jgi:hypothetical protein
MQALFEPSSLLWEGICLQMDDGKDRCDERIT